jgi:hypothetical protein
MTDFLTRLAGRALRQTPVLEPLVASWTAPVDDIDSPEAFDEPGWAERPAAVHQPRRAPGGRVATQAPVPGAVAVAPGSSAAPVRRVAHREPAAAMQPQEQPAEVEVEAPHAAAATTDAAPVTEHAAATPQAAPARTEHTRVELRQVAQPVVRGNASAVVHETPALLERNQQQQTTVRLVPAAGPERAEAVAAAAPRRELVRHDAPAVADALASERPPLAGLAQPRRHHAGLEDSPGPRRAAADQRSEPPTITVSIGRIEVRAAPSPAPLPVAAPPARPRTPPRVSLEDYLAQRSGKQP